MPLSKPAADALIDLIENKLAVMQIGDRDDLREVLVLQHCLTELRHQVSGETALATHVNEIPHRGRRRKVSAMIDEMRDELMIHHA
jgi:hypothetical protein